MITLMRSNVPTADESMGKAAEAIRNNRYHRIPLIRFDVRCRCGCRNVNEVLNGNVWGKCHLYVNKEKTTKYL